MVIHRSSQDRRNRPVGRQARVLTLQCLYMHDLRGHIEPDTVEWLCSEAPVSGAVRRNAESMIAGILDDVGQLDSTIQEYAPALPVELLAIVDRSILRVAIYEMINRAQVPSRVIINEATELASEYGSESSARFVNGVLGTVLTNSAQIRPQNPCGG
ncbi:MAG: transcription antitermination factor NusB [Chloroflexi bacterium]|nr:transcription antitermination factor NusB [Chloroflexota bacterium]